MSCDISILVADDNVINQCVIKGMLEHAGYRVETAKNGREALVALENSDFDLVIMDCLMPVMDGFSATRAIRSSTHCGVNSKIPILAITALATPHDRAKCLAAGMNDFISKPIVAGILFRMITEQLNGAGCDKSTGWVNSSGNGHLSATMHQPPQALPAILTPALINILDGDIKAWQQDLRLLADENELILLGELAHKIRGTADVLGCTLLSSYSAQLERIGKAGDSAQVSGLVRLMAAELLKLSEAIQLNV